MFELAKIIRNNISSLKPYSCARDEYKGDDAYFFDANENPFNAPYNRYPDPLQVKLKAKIAALKGLEVEQIFLGNGSDEPIDLVFRAFCEPKIDNVVAIDPTYGMYQVCADINAVEYRKVLLTEKFELEAEKLLNACNVFTKLIFICSPNNPTANLLNEKEILKVLDSFDGIVIIDEAYIDFAPTKGFVPMLKQYPNLMILQTFSKAWGMASVRMGMAFASKEIIAVLNKIKYPYNINLLTQQFVMKAIDNFKQKEDWILTLLQERRLLDTELRKISLIREVLPSDANFIIVRVDDANAVYQFLISKKMIVRNRNSVSLCMGCLRITVGTPEENLLLLEALKKFPK